MSPNMKFAFECCLRGIEKMTGREANAEINANWVEIWSIAQPLGMTKLEVSKSAWSYYKHMRRQQRQDLAKERRKAA